MRTLKALVLALPAMVVTGEAVSVMAVGALLATPAYAAKQTVSAKVGKPLQEAQNLVKAGDLKGALAKVKEAQAIPGKSAYETKTVNEFLAFVAIKQNDFGTAARAYEDLLTGSPDPAQTAQRLKVLTQLNYQTKNYAKSIQFGNRYLKEVGGDADIALLVAQSYYIQKDYNNTITATQELIKIAKAKGQPVKENWLQLQMSSYHNLNRDKEAVAVLEQMLASFPSKRYWKDMLTIVQTSGPMNDRARVELYRLKRAAEVLDADEIVEMAEMSMAIGVPGDAKSVLEYGFNAKLIGVGSSKERENRLLNKARTDSAEDQKALEAQARQAAAAASGDLDTKVGEAFMTYGQYDKAVEAITRGLGKGGVSAPDEAYLHLGQALFAQKKYAEATKAFKSVKGDSNLAQFARLWVTLVSNKQ
jgi:TolA-binding protein